MALVNQGRIAAGERPLDAHSPTEALQAIYSLPSTDFNKFPPGYNGTTNTPQAGIPNAANYNEVVGLGTPIAARLVPDLVAWSGPVTIDPTLPSGTVGVFYDQPITASGGVGPKTFTYAIASGSLPTGLSLVPTTSELDVTGTPTSSGSVTFDVTATDTNGESATAAYSLTVNAAPAPAVTSVSPASVPASGGTLVTITGTGLAGATAVDFGTTAGTIVSDSDSQIIATSPAGTPGTVDITVTTAGGTSAASSADQFTYLASPAITAITPGGSPLAGGTTVTITGTGLANATAVDFGVNAATIVSDTGTQIVATSPPSATGTVDVTVTTAGGTSPISTADQFTFGAPSVTGISPAAGPTAGGTTVTITGTNLANAAAVNFGTTAVTSFISNSATQLVVASPAGTAGAVDVMVTTGGGTSATSPADLFDYEPAPAVTGVSPAAGPTTGDTQVTITGTGLAAVTAVHFGSAPALGFFSVSDSELVALSPSGNAGVVDVTVTSPGGTSATSAADQFTYVPVPVVTHISPAKGSRAGGTQVTITGSNLANASAVEFGTTAVTTFVSDTASQIVVDSPAGTAGTVDVTVVTAGGTSAASAADQFTYGAGAKPGVSFLTPPAGPPVGGTTVIIFGTNFAGTPVVDFGTAAATVLSSSTTEVVAVSPAGSAGTLDVTVTTRFGTSPTSPADQFTYVPGPAVAGVSPSAAQVTSSGTVYVTITGTNLGAAMAVYFGTTPALSFLDTSPTEIQAVAPPEPPGTVDVTVTTPSGTSVTSSADQFTYETPPPVVTGVSPPRGALAGGTQVTITGTNLANASAVDFGTSQVPAASFVSDSATQLVVDSPPGVALGTVDVVVIAAGTSATSPADQFTYEPPPAVTAVAPAAGPVGGGTYVLITGINLAGATTVDFGTAPGTIVSNTDTAIVAASPAALAPGAVAVTVTTGDGTSAHTPADKFTYVAAPAVTSLSPASGSVAGGQKITITGSNLAKAIAVEFGTNVVTHFLKDSPSQIVLDTPAGTLDVIVVTAGGPSATSLGDEFTYGSGALPTVAYITPPTGPVGGGATVTIGGKNFAGVPVVDFGTVAATLVSYSTTQIVVLSPAGAVGSVDVMVTTAFGTSATSPADQFSYFAPTSTTVTSNEATGSTYGQAVTFTGTVSTSDSSAGTPTGSVQFQIDGANFGSPVALSGGAASITTGSLPAGTHSVVAFYISDSSTFGNSDSSAAPLSQAVSPAPLTISADNQTMTYGSPLPALTVSYAGLVNGDTPAVFTSAGNSPPVASTTATQTSDVVAGGYPITVGGAVDPNYTITYVSGTLTITPANQTVTWSNPAPIIVGTPLGSTQLDATVSVVGPASAGALTYTPAADTVLAVGSGRVLTVTAAATQDYNQATLSVKVNVLYQFVGFLAPLNTTQSFTQGSTIPVTWRLKNAAGKYIDNLKSMKSLLIQPLNSHGKPVGSPFVPASLNNTPLTYDTALHEYVFQWTTSGLAAGSYEIRLRLKDGTLHTVKIKLTVQAASVLGPNGSGTRCHGQPPSASLAANPLVPGLIAYIGRFSGPAGQTPVDFASPAPLSGGGGSGRPENVVSVFGVLPDGRHEASPLRLDRTAATSPAPAGVGLDQQSVRARTVPGPSFAGTRVLPALLPELLAEVAPDFPFDAVVGTGGGAAGRQPWPGQPDGMDSAVIAALAGMHFADGGDTQCSAGLEVDGLFAALAMSASWSGPRTCDDLSRVSCRERSPSPAAAAAWASRGDHARHATATSAR
jgi:hypothetical protein